jgi:hypothetical protein
VHALLKLNTFAQAAILPAKQSPRKLDHCQGHEQSLPARDLQLLLNCAGWKSLLRYGQVVNRNPKESSYSDQFYHSLAGKKAFSAFNGHDQVGRFRRRRPHSTIPGYLVAFLFWMKDKIRGIKRQFVNKTFSGEHRSGAPPRMHI